jgi:hypothetical protein
MATMPKHVGFKELNKYIGCSIVRFLVFPKLYGKIIYVLVLDLRSSVV